MPTTKSLCIDAKGGRHIYHRGEFGAELLVVLPFAYAAWQNNMLVETRGCSDMKAFYFFSPNHVDDDHCTRSWIPHTFKEFGWSDGPHSVLKPHDFHSSWIPPPLRAHFHKAPVSVPPGWNATRPTVVIQNKFNMEWDSAPVNFLSLAVLQQLIEVLRVYNVQVVYNRPLQYADNSDVLQLGDHDWLERHAPEVMTMQTLAAANRVSHLSYNDIQLRIMARADHFISVQGGCAIFAGYFAQGGDVVVLHRRGGEVSPSHNEYEQLFEQLGGARYTVTFDEDQLLHAVRSLAPKWILV
jgi:hypothetical protein